MADKKQKKVTLTPRQQEIKRLTAKAKAERTEAEGARLDQLKSEERRDRFVRLARKRMVKAKTAIENVGAMGNRQSYAYTPEEAEKVKAALVTWCNDALAAFDEKQQQDDGFSF